MQDITFLFKRLYCVDDDTSLLFIQDVSRRLLESAQSQSIHVNLLEAGLYLILIAGETYRGTL